MGNITLTADELNMIQTLRNAKALTAGIQIAGETGATTTSKRTHRVRPIFKVLQKGRTAFNGQLTKDGDVKLRCLEAALAKCDSLYPDQLRFWSDFRAERNLLLDSKRFCADCEAKGLVPSEVADHVLFEGKVVVSKVLQEGLQVLGEKVHMFNCPLWKDTESLYNKEGGNE